MRQTTQNSRIIKATAEEIYGAFTSSKALEAWQAPGDMTARVHHFDLSVGGGYEMSLYYPESEKEARGKTKEKEDRFTSRFVDLVPNRKIIQAVNFNTPDPAFSGEMIVEVHFEPAGDGTKVTYIFKDIPQGIKPEDNEIGTISTLEKLANFVEGQ